MCCYTSVIYCYELCFVAVCKNVVELLLSVVTVCRCKLGVLEKLCWLRECKVGIGWNEIGYVDYVLVRLSMVRLGYDNVRLGLGLIELG